MLAIVIPYYKIIFFEKTLESLAQQTDKRFRVYIGDDASPDSPEKLLEKYQGKFNFTYKKFNDNLGSISLVKQWERCIDMMKDEEWLMILGDDDVLDTNVVEQFYTNLNCIEKNINVVRYSTQVIDEQGKPVSKIYLQPLFENSIESYYRKFIGENRGSLSEFIFRYSQYKKYKFKDYPLAWTSDDRAIIDFSEGGNIYSINEAKVYFRKSSFHITSMNDNIIEKQKAHLKSLKELILDYNNVMTFKQKKFFVQLFENQIFSFSKVGFQNYIYLVYFFCKFMSFGEIIILFKSFLLRIK